MSKKLYESFECLVNGDTERADQLMHEFIIEQSKQIYRKLNEAEFDLEDGGLYVVAADRVDQVVEVCLEVTPDWNKNDYEVDYLTDRIRDSCTIIGTSDLFDKPCVVESFWT